MGATVTIPSTSDVDLHHQQRRQSGPAHPRQDRHQRQRRHRSPDRPGPSRAGTTPGATTITGVTGSAAVTNASVTAGLYTLSESGGPAGYTAGAWTCTAGILTGTVLALGPGANATCTIDNDDQPATLTLLKTVTNDSGGTAAADRLDAHRDRSDDRRHRTDRRPSSHRGPRRRRHLHAERS